MSDVVRFAPLFKERVWGGRRLADVYGKPLPEGTIGESWELVDREDDQSVALGGSTTLHELWTQERELFGARGQASDSPRFPLLVKLLDARQTLSVQVHPPATVAAELDGEPKSEMWFLAAAEPGAHLFAGLAAGVTREAFESALTAGEDVSALLHRLEVGAGDAIYLPSGRVHAIGAGCLIVEVQQSSDTTYRVFDFNRPGLDGQLRELHVEPSLACIDFTDAEPALIPRGADPLVASPFFTVSRATGSPTPVALDGECAIVVGVDDPLTLGGDPLAPGELALVPAGSAAALAGGGTALVVELPPPKIVARAMR